MRALQVPGFRLLLAGQSVNAIGTWIGIIAIWGFAAFEFDATAGDLALLFVVLSVPGAFLGPMLGVVVDRLGPRNALIVANALGFLDALALTQADSYLWIIALALPLGTIDALAAASLDAIPPRLVDDEDLISTNALLDSAQNFGFVVGPVLAAGVNALWGLEAAFLADALTYLVGIAVLLPLSVPVAERTSPPANAWADLRAGIALARRTDGIRFTFALAAVTYCVWALFGILEPLYVRDVLAESPTTFALFQTAFGVGLVTAGLALARLGDRMAQPRYVALATVVSGITAAIYLGTTWVAVAYVGVFLWGVDVAFWFTPAKTMLQRYAPTEAHGRILALNGALEPLFGIIVGGLLLSGTIVDTVGVQELGLIGGAVAVVAGLLALRAARRLGPVPTRRADPTAGSPHDGVAFGGPAPL